MGSSSPAGAVRAAHPALTAALEALEQRPDALRGEGRSRAEELGAFEGAPYAREAYRLPDGTAQLSLRDPDGHLIEIDVIYGAGDAAGVTIVPLADLRPQLGERARATLFPGGSPFQPSSGDA